MRTAKPDSSSAPVTNRSLNSSSSTPSLPTSSAFSLTLNEAYVRVKTPDQVENENKVLKDENKTLKQEAKGLKDKLATLESQNQYQENLNDCLVSKNLAYENDLQKAKDRILQLEQEAKNLKDSVDRLESEKESEKKEHTTVVQTKDVMVQQLSSKNTELATLRATYQTLQTTHEETCRKLQQAEIIVEQKSNYSWKKSRG